VPVDDHFPVTSSGEPGRKSDERSRRNTTGRPPSSAASMSSLRYPLSWPHSAGLRLTFCLLLSSDYERRFKPAMQKMTAGTTAVRFPHLQGATGGKFGVEGGSSSVKPAPRRRSTLGNPGAVTVCSRPVGRGSLAGGCLSGRKRGRAEAPPGFISSQPRREARAHGIDARGQHRPATRAKGRVRPLIGPPPALTNPKNGPRRLADVLGLRGRAEDGRRRRRVRRCHRPPAKRRAKCQETCPSYRLRLRSKDDAAPEPRVPAEPHPADDRGRRDNDGRRNDDGRTGHHDDGPVGPAAIRGGVESDPATAGGLGAERCQG
jgi:hypothetical protein